MQECKVRRRYASLGHACKCGRADLAHAGVRLWCVFGQVHIARRGNEMLYDDAGGGEGHDPCASVRPIVCHLAGKDGALAGKLQAKLLKLRCVELGYVGRGPMHFRKRPLPLQKHPRLARLCAVANISMIS